MSTHPRPAPVSAIRLLGPRLRSRRRAFRQHRFQSRLRALGVEIGPDCYIAIGSEVSPLTRFGRGTRVNGPAVFKGAESIRIGNYCAFGDGIRMISSNHRIDLLSVQRRLHRTLGLEMVEEVGEPIEVGHDVWIGDAAIILSGVRIGNGAVIGAGSVVTKDVPSFAVAAGVPAAVRRWRFDRATVDRLEDLGWWNWSEEKLRTNAQLFTTGAESWRLR